jgi:hypothetical protein
MASFGWYLIIAGVGSGLLSAFDYEFSLLIWIETWGSGFAWLIRGALILIGMALVQREVNRHQQAQQPEPAQQGPVG